MSITDYWLGLHESSTVAVRIVCRSDSNDQVTLAINGTTQNITPATAVDDGIIVFNVTGLSSSNTYPYTLTQGVQVISATAKTSGTTGSKSLIASCMGWKKPFIHGTHFASQDIDFMCIVGDQIYASQPLAGNDTGEPPQSLWNGENNSSIEFLEEALGHGPSTAEFSEEYYRHYRAYQRAKGTKEITQAIPYIQSTDDHTWPGNDPGCNAGVMVGGTGASGMNYHNNGFLDSAAEVEAQWQIGINAHLAVSKGNPAGLTMGQRSALASPRTGGELIPTDWIIGDVHYIMPEFIIERHVPSTNVTDPYAAEDYTDGISRDGQANNTTGTWPAGKHIWSPNQRDDVFSTIENSPCKYKCLLFSKSTLGRQDSFFNYDDDREELLDWLFDEKDNWTVPGGAFVVAGDVHEPEVWYEPARHHLQLCCAPSSNNVTVNTNTLRTDERWRADAPETEGSGFESVVSVESDGDILHLKLYDTALNVRWSGDIHAGSNELKAVVQPNLSVVEEVDVTDIIIGLSPDGLGASGTQYVDESPGQANACAVTYEATIPDDGSNYEIYEIGVRCQIAATGSPAGQFVEIGVYTSSSGVPVTLLHSISSEITHNRPSPPLDDITTLAVTIPIAVGTYNMAVIPEASATSNVEFGNNFATDAAAPASREIAGAQVLQSTWTQDASRSDMSLVIWARVRKIGGLALTSDLTKDLTSDLTGDLTG